MRTEQGNNNSPNRRFSRFEKGIAILSIALGGAALAGCTAVEAAPQPHPAIATSSAHPTGEASPSPTKSAEVAKFNGEVNYGDFENWEAKDITGKLQACANFFEANKPNSDVVWSNQSTGSEIASRYNALFLVVASLNADHSDPRNQTVAHNIVDCITSQHEDSNAGETLVNGMLDTNDGTITTKHLPVVDPNAITKYSDGMIEARDYENHTWIAKTIEGHDTDIGHDLLTQEFEFNTIIPNFPLYRLAVSAPSSELTGNYFGDKPPIVVGQ